MTTLERFLASLGMTAMSDVEKALLDYRLSSDDLGIDDYAIQRPLSFIVSIASVG